MYQIFQDTNDDTFIVIANTSFSVWKKNLTTLIHSLITTPLGFFGPSITYDPLNPIPYLNSTFLNCDAKFMFSTNSLETAHTDYPEFFI